LAKFLAVAAAANHLGYIARQKDQKPERPKQVIDEANHLVADCELPNAD
jgi:hypothetical protein